MAQVFAPHFDLVANRTGEHLTPAGLAQPFTWVALTARGLDDHAKAPRQVVNSYNAAQVSHSDDAAHPPAATAAWWVRSIVRGKENSTVLYATASGREVRKLGNDTASTARSLGDGRRLGLALRAPRRPEPQQRGLAGR